MRRVWQGGVLCAGPRCDVARVKIACSPKVLGPVQTCLDTFLLVVLGPDFFSTRSDLVIPGRGLFRGWVARVDARRKLHQDRGHLRGAAGEVWRWIVHRDGSASPSSEHAVEGVYTRRLVSSPGHPVLWEGACRRPFDVVSPSSSSPSTWSWTRGPRTAPSK